MMMLGILDEGLLVENLAPYEELLVRKISDDLPFSFFSTLYQFFYANSYIETGQDIVSYADLCDIGT